MSAGGGPQQRFGVNQNPTMRTGGDYFNAPQPTFDASNSGGGQGQPFLPPEDRFNAPTPQWSPDPSTGPPGYDPRFQPLGPPASPNGDSMGSSRLVNNMAPQTGGNDVFNAPQIQPNNGTPPMQAMTNAGMGGNRDPQGYGTYRDANGIERFNVAGSGSSIGGVPGIDLQSRGDNFTGTRDGMNYVNGNVNPLGTAPGAGDLGFQNWMGRYGQQAMQRGGNGPSNWNRGPQQNPMSLWGPTGVQQPGVVNSFRHGQDPNAGTNSIVNSYRHGQDPFQRNSMSVDQMNQRRYPVVPPNQGSNPFARFQTQGGGGVPGYQGGQNNQQMQGLLSLLGRYFQR